MANETNGWKYYFYSRLSQRVFSIDETKMANETNGENTIFIVDLANEFFHRWNQNGKWN